MVKALTETYWTIPEDGVLPLRVTVEIPESGNKLYRLHRPPVASGKSKVQTFDSARKLLIDLTGHPEARHWTFDRYFKKGRHGTFTPGDVSVLDVLGWTDPPIYDASITKPKGKSFTQGPIGYRTRPKFALLETSEHEHSAPLALVDGTSVHLGIDLVRRHREIPKLLFAGFGHLIRRAKYNPDDVLQEVYKGLLVRNRGRCPFDPRKASFGHYVHMVCSCVLANYHRKLKRQRSMEQLGSREWDDGVYVEKDVADSNIAQTVVGTGGLPLYATAVEDLGSYLSTKHVARTPEGKLAITVLPLHAAGCTRTEIATSVGKSKAAVSKALTIIRAHAQAWYEVQA